MGLTSKTGILAASGLLVVFGVATALAVGQRQQDAAPSITVYKTEACGCCNKWVDHLQEAGFTVVAEDVTDLNAIKQDLGVSPALASCHTAVVDGYLVEGHVPADDIRRLLEERPSAAGLAVPGMPMGSPGMEGDYRDPYDVLLFTAGGETTVYASH